MYISQSSLLSKWWQKNTYTQKCICVIFKQIFLLYTLLKYWRNNEVWWVGSQVRWYTSNPKSFLEALDYGLAILDLLSMSHIIYKCEKYIYFTYIL